MCSETIPCVISIFGNQWRLAMWARIWSSKNTVLCATEKHGIHELMDVVIYACYCFAGIFLAISSIVCRQKFVEIFQCDSGFAYFLFSSVNVCFMFRLCVISYILRLICYVFLMNWDLPLWNVTLSSNMFCCEVTFQPYEYGTVALLG